MQQCLSLARPTVRRWPAPPALPPDDVDAERSPNLRVTAHAPAHAVAGAPGSTPASTPSNPTGGPGGARRGPPRPIRLLYRRRFSHGQVIQRARGHQPQPADDFFRRIACALCTTELLSAWGAGAMGPLRRRIPARALSAIVRLLVARATM